MFSDTNGNNCGSQPEVETHRKKEKKKDDKEEEENAAQLLLKNGKGRNGRIFRGWRSPATGER
jgi:hypothetical protein